MSARRSKLDWMKDLFGADLTHAEFRVLVVFAIHSNAARDNAFLGRKRLAQEAMVNEKTARSAVKSLRSKGWLVRTDEGGNQFWKGKADVYSVRTPDVASCAKGGSDTRKGGSDAHTRGGLTGPPTGTYIRSLDHSASYESGSAQAPTAHDQPDQLEDEEQERANEEELEDAYEWIEAELDGLDGLEASKVDGMLSSGVHPRVVVNTVNKARSSPVR